MPALYPAAHLSELKILQLGALNVQAWRKLTEEELRQCTAGTASGKSQFPTLCYYFDFNRISPRSMIVIFQQALVQLVLYWS